jgi:hypothetical protein
MNMEKVLSPFTEEGKAQIIADRAEVRSLSYDEIKNKLERARDGANVHHVNKAIFYIDYMLTHDDFRYKHGRKVDRLDDLVYFAFHAMKYGTWRQLNEWMGGWF